MSWTTLIGLLLGLGGVLVGNAWEGGPFAALFQVAAAWIVFGGTFGAVLISNRLPDIKLGFALLKKIFKQNLDPIPKTIALQIVEAAQLARQESLLALEKKIPTLPLPFMKSVFRFLIDGVDPEVLRDIFRNQALQEERRQLSAVRIWSDAGGFAPTIGIIGAVLGLIHVMANLTDTTALGHGIAVAFVATIYGVGSANLLFLPIANKLQRILKEETQIKLMVIEGAVAIASGQNPYLVQEKLFSYLESDSLGKIL